MNCRHCNRSLPHTFLDLGFAPPSNAYLTKEDLTKPELSYPLKLKVCTHCWLVQTEDYASVDELFSSDYAYFSSTSLTWLAHAKSYTESVIESLGLNANSFVVEIAANDGYLLKNFVNADIPCLGIEPTESTAAVAENLNIPIQRKFFTESLARQLQVDGRQADLIIGNNVYAHVPDINDFTMGLKVALKEGGTITLEFPHLMRFIENTQFDTVYHEHFSYLSLYTVIRMFKYAGLKVIDVEELSTHGGSLRIFACHQTDLRIVAESIASVLSEEKIRGLQQLEIYQKFQARADRIKDEFLLFLLKKKTQGQRVLAYGAAAKGNTLLNYAGVKKDLLPLVCDAAPAKQGKFLPGSHIPICRPELIKECNPDYLLILPWNIADEITKKFIRPCGKPEFYVTAIPRLVIT